MPLLAPTLLWACSASPPSAGPSPSPGLVTDPAPVPEALDTYDSLFAMRNQDGAVVDANDLLGRPIILDIGFED